MEAATSVSHNTVNRHFMQIGHYHEDSRGFGVKEVTSGEHLHLLAFPHRGSIRDHLEVIFCDPRAKRPR